MEAIAARAAVVRGGEDRASHTSSALDRKQRLLASAAEVLHAFATACNTEELTYTSPLITFYSQPVALPQRLLSFLLCTVYFSVYVYTSVRCSGLVYTW